MNKKLLKVLSICLLSGAFVSATTIGIVKLTEYYSPKENAKTNPIITLSAVDKDGAAGEFNIGGTSTVSTSRYIKYGTTWDVFKNNMPIPVKSGFDITGWQYQKDENTWIDITDEYKFIENVTIRVKKWSGASPSHFATDSWQTIVDVASGGLANLKNVYSLDIADNNNSFIGKTRDVYIKGIGNFKVRVIGEDFDSIANETNKVAALTFEFVDIVYPGIGFDSSYDNWSESDLYRFLNDQFIYRLPEPINSPNVLQTVNKKSFEYNSSSSSYEIVTKPQDIFIPSLSELGVETATEDDINYTTNLEGTTYPYYLYDSNHIDKFIPSYKKKIYKDKDEKQSYVSYWTRSSFISNKTSGEKQGHAHAIDENGYVIDSDVNIAKGISPCFAIGKDDAYTLTVNVTGNELAYKANSTIVANNSTSIDIFDTDIEDEYIEPINISKFEVKVGNTVLPSSEDEGGKTVINYTYDNVNHRLIINSSKITDNVTVTVTPYQSKFHNDDWSTFLTNANKGYDNLAKVNQLTGEVTGEYKDDYNENDGSFLGLTRTVKLNDRETPYLVRVIGEKHDTTTIEDETKTTTLTFEFVKSLDKQGFDKVNNYYCSSDSQSNLKWYLDSIINNFPEELTADTGIRSSNKKVNAPNKSGVYESYEFADKLFPLSISEISTDATYLSGSEPEGTIYEYYKNNNCIYRRKEASTGVSYWLRSASNVSDEITITLSLEYGLIESSSYCNNSNATCPAFAVGLES